MKKLSNIVLKIFAIGIITCLFAGGASVLAYIAGLIIGGQTATMICAFTFTKYLPVVIQCTSIFVGLGLVGMYFSKQKALVFESRKGNGNEK